MGGRAHKVEVLSALVDRKEKSEGCQRPVIALSAWVATTTLGSGPVRSPWRSVSTCKQKMCHPDLRIIMMHLPDYCHSSLRGGSRHSVRTSHSSRRWCALGIAVLT